MTYYNFEILKIEMRLGTGYVAKDFKTNKNTRMFWFVGQAMQAGGRKEFLYGGYAKIKDHAISGQS